MSRRWRRRGSRVTTSASSPASKAPRSVIASTRVRSPSSLCAFRCCWWPSRSRSGSRGGPPWHASASRSSRPARGIRCARCSARRAPSTARSSAPPLPSCSRRRWRSASRSFSRTSRRAGSGNPSASSSISWRRFRAWSTGCGGSSSCSRSSGSTSRPS